MLFLILFLVLILISSFPILIPIRNFAKPVIFWGHDQQTNWARVFNYQPNNNRLVFPRIRIRIPGIKPGRSFVIHGNPVIFSLSLQSSGWAKVTMMMITWVATKVHQSTEEDLTDWKHRRFLQTTLIIKGPLWCWMKKVSTWEWGLAGRRGERGGWESAKLLLEARQDLTPGFKISPTGNNDDGRAPKTDLELAFWPR